MAALTNKRKLAAPNKENHEEHPRNILAQNTEIPRSQEDYISQISEEIEGRVTKKVSKKFSKTESRILNALCWLAEFFLNTLIQGHSGITPKTFRNAYVEDQGTNEDCAHPEARVSESQSTKILAQTMSTTAGCPRSINEARGQPPSVC